MIRIEQHLLFATEEQAKQVATHAVARDGAVLELDGKRIYFEDKFTLDHVNYHYRMKIDPAKRPTIEVTP